jgi:hypothetical protein
MSINKELFRYTSAFLATLMALLVPTQSLLAAIAVGQTASADAKVDGVWVPAGTTLLSPAVVATGEAPAVLHLGTGEAIALAPRTAAVVTADQGGVRLAVQQGRVAYTSNTGQVEYLSQTETLLASAQGGVQEGSRADRNQEEEDLCQLRDWTASHWQECRFDDPDNDQCDWEHIEVPMSEVPRYLEKTALLACEDRNDLDLECDCGSVAAAVMWWIPVAAVGGGWALSEIIEKEKPVASPSTP